MAQAYKCDDCGRLYDGKAETIASRENRVKRQFILVGLGDYVEVAKETLVVRYSIAQRVKHSDLESDETDQAVELCPVCQVAALLRAGISLAWWYGIPLHFEDKDGIDTDGRLWIKADVGLHLVEPKDQPEKPRRRKK